MRGLRAALCRGPRMRGLRGRNSHGAALPQLRHTAIQRQPMRGLRGEATAF